MDPGVVSMLSSRGMSLTIRNTLTQRLYYISGWSLRYMLTQGVYLQVGEIQVRISTVEQLQKLHQDSVERRTVHSFHPYAVNIHTCKLYDM